MSSLDLRQYLKALYAGKFIILLIGIIAGGSAWIIGTTDSELFQSSATIELNQTTETMFSQSKNPLIIRSQDINQALDQRGQIEVVFHQASDLPARLEINALAASPKTARLLSSEAAKVFIRRIERYERALANKTTLIKNNPTRIKMADKVKKISKPTVLKTVLAGLVGLLVGIGLIGTMEYFQQNQADSTLPSKPKSSVTP